jgi:hypothetical protein
MGAMEKRQSLYFNKLPYTIERRIFSDLITLHIDDSIEEFIEALAASWRTNASGSASPRRCA